MRSHEPLVRQLPAGHRVPLADDFNNDAVLTRFVVGCIPMVWPCTILHGGRRRQSYRRESRT
jgi:hypothetical protein